MNSLKDAATGRRLNQFTLTLPLLVKAVVVTLVLNNYVVHDHTSNHHLSHISLFHILAEYQTIAH
jgi:hypothetical protein